MLGAGAVCFISRAGIGKAASYAFTATENGWVRVLNLNVPERALVLSEEGELLETSTDDVEARIVCDYCLANREFMGSGHA